jgi:hypothetical protein
VFILELENVQCDVLSPLVWVVSKSLAGPAQCFSLIFPRNKIRSFFEKF